MPAGVATNSAWLDITHSSPSCTENWATDYLPSFSLDHPPPEYPPCKIWPASPPRNNIFVEDALLCHPLVSPIAVRQGGKEGEKGGWEGACPLFMECGEELLSDENRYVASVAARQGVTVIWEHFESMPHCFAMLFEHLKASERCFRGWAGFINTVTGNSGKESLEALKSKGVKIRAKNLGEESVDVLTLSTFTEEEVRGRMRNRVMGVKSPVPESLVTAEMAKL